MRRDAAVLGWLRRAWASPAALPRSTAALPRSTAALPLCAAALLLLAAAPAHAQGEPGGPVVAPESGTSAEIGEAGVDDRAPVTAERIARAYAQRPITMPARTLRLSGFFSGAHLEFGIGQEFVFAFQIGGAYGITDDLEIGVGTEKLGPSAIGAGRAAFSGWRPTGEGLLSFVVADGDLDFGDIPVYGRYRFLDTELVEVGAELAVLIPTRTDFALRLGAPVRLHGGEIFALDTGLYFSMIFGTDPAPSGPDDEFWGGMWIPIRPVLNVADWLGLALTTGVHIGPFDNNWVSIPLGLEVVASFPMGSASMLDLVAGFEWPAFLRPATDDNDKAEVGTYVLSAGARLYLGL